MAKLGTIPFAKLKVGDELVSCTGKKGWIGGLFPEGSTDPMGYESEYGGHILMLWFGMTFSLSYHMGSEVEYVGK